MCVPLPSDKPRDTLVGSFFVADSACYILSGHVFFVQDQCLPRDMHNFANYGMPFKMTC